MAPPTLNHEEIVKRLKVLAEEGGVINRACRRLGIGRDAMHNTLMRAETEGIDISSNAVSKITKPRAPIEAPAAFVAMEPKDRVLNALRRGGAGTLEAIASRAGLTKGEALDALDELGQGPHNLRHTGDQWSIERTQPAAYTSGSSLQFMSTIDNAFKFGVISDTHLGSKYERLDALDDCYQRFAAAGVQRVFHCGNYIEGEASFNRHEIHTHGMDAQIKYLVDRYPRTAGIETFAVTGDDHEGWYGQREGIEIGRHTQNMMRQGGREDWHDLGFMEAHIDLVNANTGKVAVMAAIHPGGGSAYAESYAVQKTIETLDGGEKPAVALYGHWHKMLAGEYRNVWFVLVPSTKDQDPFMRKRRIRSVVGGGIIMLEQDPETGAIIGMTPQLWRYFVKGYYGGRWSHADDVTLPRRDTK